MVSELLMADAHRMDTARICWSRKLDRFTSLRELSAVRSKNSRSNRRRLPARETRRPHQAPIPESTMYGHSRPTRSREAMRTTSWQRTARPFAFFAVMVAGWPGHWLTLGSGWTLVRIPAGAMKSPRPAIADRDGPASFDRRVTSNTSRRRSPWTSRDLPGVQSILEGSEPFPGRAHEDAP